ncbi:MAG: deoxyguanosinetriphosphate triphosphohydrolase [Candidatus Omnitrophica bacterium]|nr:deoxyguanosinetriphosphate triphosphohydrolase [Candidatus Omnitrophota bacterium]
MRTRKDIEELESKVLAPYAMKSKDAGARQYSEPAHEWRTSFQRDRDRIVHAEAFRKLEYKTQVFVIFEGDYYRTRLTHTIEVAQLARTLGRNLRLNEDLIEAVALAHDLGHPPFGHAGEAALNEIVREADIEFNHNFRSYEIVAKLEKKYPGFPGLNLTREVLVGILKHQTVFDMPGANIPREYRMEGPTLEAQIVDIADSLAYLNHDIDDGLTSECIVEHDLMESALWQRAVQKIGADPKETGGRDMFRYQVVKELIDMQVKDLLKATYERIRKFDFKSAQEVKDHKGYVAAFSQGMHRERQHLQRLLDEKLYHHWRVERMTTKARRIIRDLFEVYLKNPKQLPYSIYGRDQKHSRRGTYAVICNYIASMTDRFALDEHRRLFDPYQRSE